MRFFSLFVFFLIWTNSKLFAQIDSFELNTIHVYTNDFPEKVTKFKQQRLSERISNLQDYEILYDLGGLRYLWGANVEYASNLTLMDKQIYHIHYDVHKMPIFKTVQPVSEFGLSFFGNGLEQFEGRVHSYFSKKINFGIQANLLNNKGFFSFSDNRSINIAGFINLQATNSKTELRFSVNDYSQNYHLGFTQNPYADSTLPRDRGFLRPNAPFAFRYAVQTDFVLEHKIFSQKYYDSLLKENLYLKTSFWGFQARMYSENDLYNDSIVFTKIYEPFWHRNNDIFIRNQISSWSGVAYKYLYFNNLNLSIKPSFTATRQTLSSVNSSFASQVFYNTEAGLTLTQRFQQWNYRAQFSKNLFGDFLSAYKLDFFSEFTFDKHHILMNIKSQYQVNAINYRHVFSLFEDKNYGLEYQGQNYFSLHYVYHPWQISSKFEVSQFWDRPFLDAQANLTTLNWLQSRTTIEKSWNSKRIDLNVKAIYQSGLFEEGITQGRFAFRGLLFKKHLDYQVGTEISGVFLRKSLYFNTLWQTWLFDPSAKQLPVNLHVNLFANAKINQFYLSLNFNNITQAIVQNFGFEKSRENYSIPFSMFLKIQLNFLK
ncbi:MAG: hypothetical protein MUE53_00790 [Chitinophagales bacterium]|nr:hypothetical protein [Chitinophagales bacterium]